MINKQIGETDNTKNRNRKKKDKKSGRRIRRGETPEPRGKRRISRSSKGSD